MTEKPVWVCPRCGTPPTGARFCGECGLNLADLPELVTLDQWRETRRDETRDSGQSGGAPAPRAHAPSAAQRTKTPSSEVEANASRATSQKIWMLGGGAALLVLVIVVVLAASGGGSSTITIDCYDIMNRTASFHSIADTPRNEYNFRRCQEPGHENDSLEWDPS